ncbi:YufK like protein [Sporosarcina newyorkensis 2681]|uniref:YufK like protein n=1 Tax=Sporosarcina newyorkensis 2681 TaxID=1027292 RepID=F9DWY4_9BACL|nr:YufK family protein [Sporosarcina newyorkensis]EGQ21278.1 YufK like protein [Sporosarcina newyorkensis 2681]
MKNPYLFGYLPFVTVVLFSLTFGVYSVGESIIFFKEIGLYQGMREFLSDFQLRIFLLTMYTLLFFMVFAALKLIATTIHETALLFFLKEESEGFYSASKSGAVIYFVGALVSAFGIQSWKALVLIFIVTSFVYFIYAVYKLSPFMSLTHTVGLIFFQIVIWSVLLAVLIYIVIRLYNGLLASIPLSNPVN